MTNLTEKEKQSDKKLMREIIPATVILFMMIAGSRYLVKDMNGTFLAYPLALSPLIPVLFIIHSIVNFIMRTDELMRKIYGDSAVITLVIVIFLGMAYGLLNRVGLPQPDIFMAACLIYPLYVLVFYILRRKYGVGGC